MKKQRTFDLGSAPIGRLLCRFAVPSIVAMLINSLYSIVDQIFIGRGVGYLGNGATNVVFLVTLITLSLSMLLGDGAAAFYSLRLGNKETERAAKGFGGAITLVSVLGLLALAVCFLFLEPILKLFGAAGRILPLAIDYGKIVILGVPLAMAGNTLNALIRADGSPRYAMISMISGAILNVILDPLFLFGFGWGVKGAAFATVLGQLVSFLISVLYLRRVRLVKLCPPAFLPDLRITGQILALGISSFIDQLSFTLVMAVCNNLIVHYGAQSAYGSEIPLSAFGVAMKVQQILFAVVLGISVGMQPIAGFNYGAKKYARVRKVGLLATLSASLVCLMGSILLVGFPQVIVGLFGAGEQTLYAAFSQRFMQTYFLLITFMGFQTAAGVFFQAIGKPAKAAAISLSYQLLFRIGLAVLLCSRLGLDGVLWSGPAADFLTFLLAAVLLTGELRGLRRSLSV